VETGSTGYVELPSGKSAPEVTVTLPTGAEKALVSVTATMLGSAGGAESCYMSFLTNGKALTSTAEGDAHALILAGASLQAASATFVVESLTAGSNKFTAVYRAGKENKACNFSNRSIWAIPLP
jgi:hypothetical protein